MLKVYKLNRDFSINTNKANKNIFSKSFLYKENKKFAFKATNFYHEKTQFTAIIKRRGKTFAGFSINLMYNFPFSFHEIFDFSLNYFL